MKIQVSQRLENGIHHSLIDKIMCTNLLEVKCFNKWSLKIQPQTALGHEFKKIYDRKPIGVIPVLGQEGEGGWGLAWRR